MRSAAAAIFGISALVAGTHAQAATTPQVWQGTLFVQTVQKACTDAGVTSVGDYYTVVYRPIISGTQTGPEGLSFISARAGQLWTTLSATASFANPAVANILALGSHATSVFATSTGGYGLIILPNPIAANTPTVTITGQLQSFWDVGGCDVTVAASLQRRP